MSLFSAATVSGVKEDARHIAESAVEAARERVVDPAIEAARHARERVIDPAVDVARDAMKQTRDFISNQSTHFQRAASDGRDRLTVWVSENPFSALGAAFVAGLLCSSLFRINQR